ncbi:hypothetical protein H6764_03310 [Candidatus Nomurabacteria bacterium]|nr:hypothetical protein [Candidatus Nomurabacteria bacterium]
MKEALNILKQSVCSLKIPQTKDSKILEKVKKNTIVGLMAGGEGTRFKTVSSDQEVNKNSFKLPNGDTMIERTIRIYRDAGVTNFVALVYTHADSIVDLLGDGTKLGVNIKYSYDPKKPVGKGGAVKNAFLNNSFDDSKYLIIHNPDDQIVNFEDKFVDRVISGHLEGEEKGKMGTIVVVEETPYTFTGMDIYDNEVKEIEMYPMIPIPTHTGVTVFSPGMFKYFDDLFDLSKKSDFEKVLFPLLTKKKLLYAVSIPNNSWIAVNDPKAYKEFLKYLDLDSLN